MTQMNQFAVNYDTKIVQLQSKTSMQLTFFFIYSVHYVPVYLLTYHNIAQKSQFAVRY